MGLFDNFVTRATSAIPFINDNPAQAIQRIAGSVLGRTTATGPLADLYGTRNTLNTHQYPIDLGAGPNQNWIVFKVLQSVQTVGAAATNPFNSLPFGGVSNSTSFRNNPNTGLGVLGDRIQSALTDNAVGSALGLSGMKLFSAGRKVKATSTSIALNVPNTLVFSQANEYSETGLTHALGAALAYAQYGSAAGALSGDVTADKIKNSSTLFGTEAITNFALSAETAALALMGITGTVVNPQIEVLFTKTQQRTMQFDFAMAARSKAEMDAIQNIVRAFREAAAPSFAAGGAGRFLIPPNEFDIEFVFKGGPARMIPKLATCVLENVVVDMAPSGQYSTFEDGRPVSVRLQLNFKEVDLITRERVKEGF